jgi:hypothetical protein
MPKTCCPNRLVAAKSYLLQVLSWLKFFYFTCDRNPAATRARTRASLSAKPGDRLASISGVNESDLVPILQMGFVDGPQAG